MRVVIVGPAIALFACAGSAPGPETSSSPADAGGESAVPDAGVADIAISLTFSGDGAGTIQSADGTIACSAACTVRAPAGKTVELVPAAASGSHFDGWTGACAGTGRCTLTLRAEASATGRFVKDAPAYHPTGTLWVKRSGAGRITSEPMGIDCESECFTYFPHYGPVTLTATPADGFRFAGWGGACAGTGSCVVDMGAASVVVTVVFEHVLPLPDGCADVMPASIPRPVLFDPGAGLLMDATSDSTGENFLLTVNPGGPADDSRDFHFVHIQDGAATQLAVRSVPYRNDATTFSIARGAESQPVGFNVFRSSGLDTVFDVYAPDGTLARTVSLLQPLQPGETSQNTEYSIVPSGGVAVLRDVWRGTSGYTVHYARFDAAGFPVVSDAPVDRGGSYLVSWGVGASGNVLLVGAQGNPFSTGDIYGRWLDAQGAPLTDWFRAGDEYIRNFFLLRTPSTLALNATGYYSLAFPDTEGKASPAPDWLGGRGEQALQMVRGGFVSYGVLRYGEVTPCGWSPEVLTRTGVSCGCLALPDVFENGNVFRIGRDGSLLTQHWLAGASRGVFEVYPGLFR